MIGEFEGGAKFPGPLGLYPGNLGGRVPGPLRFDHVDLAKGATMAAKKRREVFIMPGLADLSNRPMRALSVPWKLSKGSPRKEDIEQGELANCPIPAILAALAHTASGKARLNSMITEYSGAFVMTALHPLTTWRTLIVNLRADDPHDPVQFLIRSARYFRVKLGTVEIDISDVFYVVDGTEDMVYMNSPNKALWPCVIEKAYASHVGGYQKLDDKTHTAPQFWTVLVGSQPEGFLIDDVDDAKIIKVANAASTIPAIAASRDNALGVLGDHGFAVLGMQASKKINLFDSFGGPQTLTLDEFRRNFEAMYFGKP